MTESVEHKRVEAFLTSLDWHITYRCPRCNRIWTLKVSFKQWERWADKGGPIEDALCMTCLRPQASEEAK